MYVLCGVYNPGLMVLVAPMNGASQRKIDIPRTRYNQRRVLSISIHDQVIETNVHTKDCIVHTTSTDSQKTSWPAE